MVISGYYGFGNLGDEAIAEELTNELKRLVEPEKIVILSNDPEKTRATFGVKSLSRWNLSALAEILPNTRLFISGGGGLFQDTASFKSCLYYGGQIVLSRLMGARALVYAQGVGPLKGAAARAISRFSIAMANGATVRDKKSQALLAGWKIDCSLTADPVWCLQASPLPESLSQVIAGLRAGGEKLLIGLSLRESRHFQNHHLTMLTQLLDQALPAAAEILLLPLQEEQDRTLLQEFASLWQERGRAATWLDTAQLKLPSQWLSLMEELDMVVGMRLHALIMALSSGVPVLGIAYDPKVTAVLEEFQQPILNLTNNEDEEALQITWEQTSRGAVEEREALSRLALSHAQAAKNTALQNFEILAKILNMQSV